MCPLKHLNIFSKDASKLSSGIHDPQMMNPHVSGNLFPNYQRDYHEIWDTFISLICFLKDESY